MATSLKTRIKIANFVDRRESFRIGNISAQWLSNANGYTYHFHGILPEEYKKDLNNLLDKTDVYVVYSYNTPIAWNSGENGKYDWTIPDVTYSRTTTHHQSLLKTATLPIHDNPYLRAN